MVFRKTSKIESVNLDQCQLTDVADTCFTFKQEDHTMTSSYQAGVQAAKDGVNINNSYPHEHEEFVAGHKSISGAKEDLALKALSMNMAPSEYPHEEVDGIITNNDIYLFDGKFYSADVDVKGLHMINTLREEGHLKKVKMLTVKPKRR